MVVELLSILVDIWGDLAESGVLVDIWGDLVGSLGVLVETSVDLVESGDLVESFFSSQMAFGSVLPTGSVAPSDSVRLCDTFQFVHFVIFRIDARNNSMNQT